MAEAFDHVGHGNVDKGCATLKSAGDLSVVSRKEHAAHYALMQSLFHLAIGDWEQSFSLGQQAEKAFVRIKRHIGASHARWCQAEAALRAGTPSIAVAALNNLGEHDIGGAKIVETWARLPTALCEIAFNRLAKLTRVCRLLGEEARASCQSIWLLHMQTEYYARSGNWKQAFDYAEHAIELAHSLIGTAAEPIRADVIKFFVDLVATAANCLRQLGNHDKAAALHETFGAPIGYRDTTPAKPAEIMDVRRSRASVQLVGQALGCLIITVTTALFTSPGEPLTTRTWHDAYAACTLSYGAWISTAAILIHTVCACSLPPLLRRAPFYILGYTILPWILMLVVGHFMVR